MQIWIYSYKSEYIEVNMNMNEWIEVNLKI